MKRALLLVAVLALCAAAVLGLLLGGDPESTRSAPASRSPSEASPPPVDHIDESSREALREILREEGGG